MEYVALNRHLTDQRGNDVMVTALHGRGSVFFAKGKAPLTDPGRNAIVARRHDIFVYELFK